MNRFYLLYKRLQLNTPEDAKVYLSKNMSKIYYLKKEEEKIIEILDLNIPDELQTFLTCEIICEKYNDWYKIVIYVNLEKFNELVRSPYKLSARKEFFEIIRRCSSQQDHNYESHTNINMKEDILRPRDTHRQIRIKKHKQCLLDNLENSKWILYREKCANLRYKFYKDIYKLDQHYINFKEGVIKDDPGREIKIKGGIITDKLDCYWIKSFLQTITHCTRTYTPPLCDNLIRSRATLIICKSVMCNYWYDQINDINPKLKVIKINSKSKHNEISYNRIIKSNFVIVSIDYIKSKSYRKIWGNYLINDNISLQDVYNMILRDNINNKKFNNNKNPIFSLIHWKRLIIDNESFDYFLEDNNVSNIIYSIKSSYRWLNINSPNINNSYDHISFLSNTKITTPIYDDDDHIHLLKNIIRSFDNSKISSKCNSKIKLIEMNPIIKTINDLCKDDIYKTTILINKLSSNRLSKPKLKQLLKTKSLYSSSVINDILSTNICNICQEEKEKQYLIVTDCGHTYCASCVIENLRYTTKCAICRSNIDIDNIYPISYSSKTDKYSRIIKNIPIGEKTIIYISDMNVIEYLKKLLNRTDISYNICEGSNLQKIKIVDKFNKNKSDLLVMHLKDNELSRNLKNISNISFANINQNILNNRYMYCGYDYINGSMDTVNVQYYLYKNSVEHNMVC